MTAHTNCFLFISLLGVHSSHRDYFTWFDPFPALCGSLPKPCTRLFTSLGKIQSQHLCWQKPRSDNAQRSPGHRSTGPSNQLPFTAKGWTILHAPPVPLHAFPTSLNLPKTKQATVTTKVTTGTVVSMVPVAESQVSCCSLHVANKSESAWSPSG